MITKSFLKLVKDASMMQTQTLSELITLEFKLILNYTAKFACSVYILRIFVVFPIYAQKMPS